MSEKSGANRQAAAKQNKKQKSAKEQRIKQLNDLIESLETELQNQVQTLKIISEEITQTEQERNFYYNKLVSIENICSTKEAEELGEQVLDII